MNLDDEQRFRRRRGNVDRDELAQLVLVLQHLKRLVRRQHSASAILRSLFIHG